MQERTQNKQLYILHSNIVDAKKQCEYLIELTEESLNSKANYNGEVSDNTAYSIINKDLSRNGKEMIILGEKAPEYALTHKDMATQAILEYKKNLITHLQAKNVPEDRCDQLASMMINLNNQGLYIGLGYMITQKLMGEPFVPIGNTSYKVIFRQEVDNYFIDAKIFTNVAHIDETDTILTTIDINYTFDVVKNTMQLKVEDVKNYAEINEDFKEIFKDICKDLMRAKNSDNVDVKTSLFAADFDLKKAKTENNRNSHIRAGLYTLGSLLLVVLYAYNKISSRNNHTGEHPPQDYTNSTTEQNYTNWIDATRAPESIVQYTPK